MSTLIEIKAEAIALHALGYSCRNIEKQLKAKFPKADIPNYGTIASWVRVRPTAPIRKYRSQYTTLRWWEAAQRAAEIVHERMATELENQPYNKVAAIYGRMMDVVFNLERLQEPRLKQSRGNDTTLSTDCQCPGQALVRQSALLFESPQLTGIVDQA